MNFKRISLKKILLSGIAFFLIIIIKVLSVNTQFVEDIYATGFYQQFAVFLRFLFGWIPFSIGDILYLVAVWWLLKKTIYFFINLFKKRLNVRIAGKIFFKLISISVIIYIVFNAFWGLNYNRKGIEYQLGISSGKYDSGDLKIIQKLLIKKVNESKIALIRQHLPYPDKKELFKRAVACYSQCKNEFSFLNYRQSSVKSSLYGWLGNYLGFTGYYNPFTGEAQVNTTVPNFILPYTTTHEMAHQLGYAKEDEANFVGYIAATASADTLFHYSTYLDLFVYANAQVYYIDSNAAKQGIMQLIPEVKTDLAEWRKFLRAHRSPVEYVISWAYGKYLKANQQPHGLVTYDEVIGDLIAFYKKFGRI